MKVHQDRYLFVNFHFQELFKIDSAVDFLLKPVECITSLPVLRKAIADHAHTLAMMQQRRGAERRVEKLSRREREVLQQVLRGRLNKQIAADLGVVEKTIKVHRSHIMHKMGAGSLAELVQLCGQAGLSGEQSLKDSIGLTAE